MTPSSSRARWPTRVSVPCSTPSLGRRTALTAVNTDPKLAKVGVAGYARGELCVVFAQERGELFGRGQRVALGKLPEADDGDQRTRIAIAFQIRLTRILGAAHGIGQRGVLGRVLHIDGYRGRGQPSSTGSVRARIRPAHGRRIS